MNNIRNRVNRVIILVTSYIALSTHNLKTFVIGFVVTIKSIFEMSNEMFTLSDNPFRYILTYKSYQFP